MREIDADQRILSHPVAVRCRMPGSFRGVPGALFTRHPLGRPEDLLSSIAPLSGRNRRTRPLSTLTAPRCVKRTLEISQDSSSLLPVNPSMAT